MPGIYDELLSHRVAASLKELPGAHRAVTHSLASGQDVTTVLTTWVHEALELALDAHRDDAAHTIAMAEAVLEVLRAKAPKAFERGDELRLHPQRLEAIVEGASAAPSRPRGSLHASSLLVNAAGEALLEHLRSEFDSADRVDLLCAFIKLSGFEKLRGAIERHCEGRGRPLRVLTTTYMGASDAKAIERLARLRNVEVHVSYDDDSTRLHAKAWVFHRASGVSTAYVGSSNLSHAAQTEGLEWNVRLTESDQGPLVAQMRETFEQYWSDAHLFRRFDPTDEAHRTHLSRALSHAGRVDAPPAFLPELEPKSYQTPILEELDAARLLARHRNLLVAATGTGKTVMAALDYRRLRASGAVDTILFVAHRREILEQARQTFRAALQLRDFGELLYDGVTPTIGRHVFASIDSLPHATVPDLTRFDMVIVDEAHHAAADKWATLLDAVRPRELLGLTGTPERADGIDYDRHFPRPWVGNLRVWSAIPHALVPFRYYMLDVEGVDLRDVKWTAGRYAPEALAQKLIGAAEVFVRKAVAAVVEHVARPEALRGIAFCVNVRHAEEVARRFQQQGLTAVVLTGGTRNDARRDARSDLDAGRIHVLCVVDIYNEGVDVPNVNTLFFFRPTESATIFLQQLGRGLRRAPGKAELVVFDLTGRQRLEFRFDRNLRSMLGHTPRELRTLLETGFGRLPAGCLVSFEEQARADVLSQMRRAVPQDTRALRALLREPAHADLSLSGFLDETDVGLDVIYGKGRSWNALRREAGLRALAPADDEALALENVHKILHVGDALRLDVWAMLLRDVEPTSEREARAARMLFAVLYGKEVAATTGAFARWARDAALREEIAALMPLLARRNATLAPPHTLHPEVPLALHGRYLGVELSVAFDQRTRDGHFREYYTGVERTKDGAFDMLLVTLEKANAKEHLRYRDFPLNERRFHWQSKSRTTRDSLDARRLLDPRGEGCTPLLFVRERSDDRPGVTMAFQYLGPVTPDGDAGERPISIEWRLDHSMPAELARRGRIAA